MHYLAVEWFVLPLVYQWVGSVWLRRKNECSQAKSPEEMFSTFRRWWGIALSATVHIHRYGQICRGSRFISSRDQRIFAWIGLADKTALLMSGKSGRGSSRCIPFHGRGLTQRFLIGWRWPEFTSDGADQTGMKKREKWLTGRFGSDADRWKSSISSETRNKNVEWHFSLA